LAKWDYNQTNNIVINSREAVFKYNKLLMKKVITFIKEAREELKKVSWLSREKTLKYTGVVIGVSLAVAIFLGILDMIFSNIIGGFIV
jgi:preprotein translocase subunit SecE